MEPRKLREEQYHDGHAATGRPDEKRKWYAAGAGAKNWMIHWLDREASRKRVLDCGCGTGALTARLSSMGAKVTGIDISNSSIEIARQATTRMGLKADYRVMDVEHTEFDDSTFDIIVCRGILHHLDLKSAYRETARILKPGGSLIALEAFGHNPFINWYRKRTPSLRTPDERPLRKQDIELANRYYGVVKLRYFNLLTLLAAPLWRTPLLGLVSGLLGTADAVLLRMPVIQRQAWMVGMVLSAPRPDGKF